MSNYKNVEINYKEELQESLDEYGEDYILKTNEELIDIICDFDMGETEFHTVDIERLIKENDKQYEIIDELIKFIEDKNIELSNKIKS